MAAGWPVRLQDGDVVLRPLRARDGREWRRLRLANDAWLSQWEASAPDAGTPALSFGQLARHLAREARAGRALPFAVELRGELVGQLTVGGISWGSMRSAHVGYWVSEDVAGQGIIPTAVALATDHCFQTVGLHRVEVNIRPENHASLRVVTKLGFRDEGVRERFLHIDGDWRDHRTFALTAEEVPGGLLTRWHETQRRADHPT